MAECAPSPERAVAALQALGAGQRDPVRYRYLVALAAQLPRLQGAVRAALEQRFQEALQDCQARCQAAPPHRAPGAAGVPDAGLAELVQLNADLRASAAARAQPELLDAACDPDPHALPSVRQFHRAWARSQAQEQLAQALARAPRNAGPLNAHRLVLRSLALMRQLSPDYLQQFLAHAEALHALEHVSGTAVPKGAKPERRSRTKA